REDERPISRALRWARLGQCHVERMAEAGLEILDDEDVGEVGGQLQPELDLDAAMAEVLDDDPLLHTIADEPLPLDDELVRLEAAGERVPQHERGEVRRRVLVREGIESRAAERQHGAREEARVGGEEAGGGGETVDVAALVADAKGRPVENRERQRYAAGPTARLLSSSNSSTLSSGTENISCCPACKRGSTGSLTTSSWSPSRRCPSCSSPRYSTTST